jgi:hypothetical protein
MSKITQIEADALIHYFDIESIANDDEVFNCDPELYNACNSLIAISNGSEEE